MRTTKRQYIPDVFVLLTVIIIIAVDQWTKFLVITHLGPAGNGSVVPIIGDYLTLYYIQNRGAAFGLFANNAVLVILIVIAISIIAYLYLRMRHTAPLIYKFIFGMIIGGAAGNLLDRALHGGYVIDFIFFRIPQVGFRFAIFNLADAVISVSTFLLFVSVLWTGWGKHRAEEVSEKSVTAKKHEKAKDKET